MNFEAYEQAFLEILSGKQANPPYDNLDYVNYVKLNWFRQERWLKTGVLQQELIKRDSEDRSRTNLNRYNRTMVR